MKRQLDDYYDKFYNKMAARFATLAADDNKKAKEIALWKETVAERWDSIHVVDRSSNLGKGLITGNNIDIRVVVDEQGLNDAVGLELVVLKNDMRDRPRNQTHHPVPAREAGRKPLHLPRSLRTIHCRLIQDCRAHVSEER